MKKTVISICLLSVVSVLFLFAGCGKEAETDRLVRLEVNQKYIERSVKDLGQQIVSLRGSINQLKQTLEQRQRGFSLASIKYTPSDTESGMPQGRGVAEIDDEKRLYSELALKLSVLQQQLEESFQTVEELDNRMTQTERVASRRPLSFIEMQDILSNPEELNKRIDAMAADFTEKITDENIRSDFEADIEHLKKMAGMFNEPNFNDHVRARLTEQINNTDNERRRDRLTSMLESLDNSPGEEPNDRIVRYIIFDNLREMRDVVRKYDIPTDILRDHGLYFRGPGGRRGR